VPFSAIVKPFNGMLRLTAVSRRTTGLLAVIAVLAAGAMGARVARDQGAFGCAYQPRERMTDWRLAGNDPRMLRVRVGEGVLVVSPDGGPLRDVVVDGDAGLAAGTQNGVRDYVFAVTEHGPASVVAKTMSGKCVTGRLQAHC
jgi:hypothetical protein